jgi:hypothetical protein
MGKKMSRERREVETFRSAFQDRFRVFWFTSIDEGCAGYELCPTDSREDTWACRITYWDAVGQYFIEMAAPEISAFHLLRLLKITAERVGVPIFEYSIVEQEKR